MPGNPEIVTCETAKYSVKCKANHPLMPIKMWCERVAPYMPYDPCTLFLINGKPLYGEETVKYQEAPIMGSEFEKMESGLVENAATIIDGKTACVQRIWKYYDADGEYYISKAIFWLCESNCPICQEKVKKAMECSCCDHECQCCHDDHCDHSDASHDHTCCACQC
ncbi:hypothetical protein WA538_004836 [Blastocystis sp. DL]